MNYKMHQETITDTSTGTSIEVTVLETFVQLYYHEHPSWLEYGPIDEQGHYFQLGWITNDFHPYVKVEHFDKGQMYTAEHQEEYRFYVYPLFPFAIAQAERREGLQGKVTHTIIYAENMSQIGKTWDE